MRLVLGIGNPGRHYAGTRHNVGFRILDEVAARRGTCFRKASSVAMLADVGLETRLMKPLTYVNRSGTALTWGKDNAMIEEASELLVVVDDTGLPPGRIRLRAKGSSGGHNGLSDIERVLGGDDYSRLRVGIGAAPRGGLVDHVLGTFDPEEHDLIDLAVERAADAVVDFVEDVSVMRLMERYNRAPEPNTGR